MGTAGCGLQRPVPSLHLCRGSHGRVGVSTSLVLVPTGPSACMYASSQQQDGSEAGVTASGISAGVEPALAGFPDHRSPHVGPAGTVGFLSAQ